jgi:hypothetical protein
VHTQELAESICTRLADGESLNAICNDLSISEATVRGWYVDDYAGFAAIYSRARDIGIDVRMERLRDKQVALMELIDRDSPPQLVAAYKQAWEAERWHAAKCFPRKYGDKALVAVNIDMRAELAKLQSQLEEKAFAGDPDGLARWRAGESVAPKGIEGETES